MRATRNLDGFGERSDDRAGGFVEGNGGMASAFVRYSTEEVSPTPAPPHLCC